MTRTFYKSILFATTALSVGLPMAAMAQDDNSVEEIVVTARRVQEPLEKVPMSISVLSQSQLTDRNIFTANDLATFVPALTVNDQFGSDASSFVIRGFSQDIGTSPTVGTYFADVVEPRGGFGGATIHAGEGAGPGDFFDLQNVQILKGPQGTLFGRNTTGGAVLLVPQKPTDEFGGYVEASYGDYDMERLQAVLNIPVDDHLRVRIGVDQQTRDGYVKNISGIGPNDFNNINYIAGRISVDADITSNLENYTIGSFTNSRNNGSDTQIVACAQGQVFTALVCGQLAAEGTARGPYTVDSSLINPKSLIQEWQVINNTTWTISDDVTFKNIASWSQEYIVNNSSLFGDDFKVAPGFPPLEFTGEDTPPGMPLSSQGTVTEEPRFNGTAFDNRMQWQAGLYGEMSYPVGISGSSGPNFIACNNFVLLQCYPTATGDVGQRFGTITYRDYGAYAQDTFAITDRWSLTTGIRYSEDLTKDSVTRLAYIFSAPNPPTPPTRICEPLVTSANCVVADRQLSHAPTGVFNLEYKINDDMLGYVQYSRGYRQGSILATGPIGYTTFQPEHLNAYEIGVKDTLEGDYSGYVNAAFFYNDFTDQQLLGTFLDTNNLAVAPNAGILNVGSSRIYGLDIDASVTPGWFPDLTVNFGYTYLNSLLVKTNIPPLSGSFYNVFGTNEVQGSPLALTPTNKVSLTATYRLPLDPDIGKVSFGVNWVYTDPELVYGDGPYAHIPNTNVFNLNVNWAAIYGGPFDAEFFMTNVTDLHYPTYVDNFASPNPTFAQYGLVAESFAPPRMFGFRLRYNF